MRIASLSLGFLALATATAVAGPTEEVGKAVTEVFQIVNTTPIDDNAMFVTPHGLGPYAMFSQAITGMDASPTDPKERDRQITISADDKSAWVSAGLQLTLLHDNDRTDTKDWRVSMVLAKTDRWRVIVGAWTLATPNAKANADAKAGKLPSWRVDDNTEIKSDAKLAAAFAKLTTDGLDATAAARKDLVVFGSGPGERTVGGAGFAKAWTAAWVKHVTITSSLAVVAPSGTTGWVAATIELAKGTGKAGYKIPFLMFCVFDKTAAGWSLAHVHFSI